MYKQLMFIVGKCINVHGLLIHFLLSHLDRWYRNLDVTFPISGRSCCVEVCTNKISECQKLSEKVKTHFYDVHNAMVCSSTAQI